MLWKCQQIWKTQQWPQDWKRSVFIPIPKKGNAKECSNYHTIALISHASKVMWCSKFSKPGLNSMWTMNFQMFKLDLEKAKVTEIKLPTSLWLSKKQESSRKTFQFSSVSQLCPTLCDPMNCSTPGLPVHHHLPRAKHPGMRSQVGLRKHHYEQS